MSSGMTLLNLDSKQISICWFPQLSFYIFLSKSFWWENLLGFYILSGFLVGAQSKGELSTSDGSSMPGTSTTPADIVDHTDDDGVDGMSLSELEKDCEEALAQMVPPVHPSHPPNPSVSAEGGGKGRPVTPPATSGNSGNLALALTSGGGLTPSQLHTPELETQVVGELKQLSEEQFEAKVEELKQHHEFNSYCDAVRLEIGGQEDDAPEEKWEFGEQECYLDVVGLMVWIRARENMRRALGVQVPSLTVEPKVEPVEAPAAKVEDPEPVPVPPTAPPAVLPTAPTSPIIPTPHTMFFPPPAATPTVPTNLPPSVPPAAPPTAPPTVPLAAPPTAPPTVPPAALPTAPPTVPPAAPSIVPTVPPAAPPAPPIEPTNVPAPGDLSARVDTVAVTVAADAKPTSSTHRKEYMAFLRAAKNPTPTQLFWKSTIIARNTYYRITVGKAHHDFPLIHFTCPIALTHIAPQTCLAKDKNGQEPHSSFHRRR